MQLRIANNQIFLDKKLVSENSILLITGYFFYEKKMYFGKMAEQWLLDKINTVTELTSLIKNMNGVFAVIIFMNGKVLICSDRYGFYPLYYIRKSNEILISENCKELLTYSEKKYDRGALYEMAGLGYTLGSKTLLADIKEFLPHNITTLYFQNKKLLITDNSYWEFEFLQNNDNVKLEKFADIWNEIMQDFSANLIENEFYPYIPLSGGLDSRLLAFSFTQNETPFYSMTYGSSADDKDILISKKVARIAGKYCLSHETFVLDQLFLNELVKESMHSDRLTCALFSEKNSFYQKIIEDKAQVYIPGHAGDFLAGSHINMKMKSWRSYNDIPRHIIKQKSSIIPSLWQLLPDYKEVLIYELTLNLKTDIDLIPSFMTWNLENRQRKYIVRSALYGERQKMLPVFPFFDYRLVDLFSKLKLKDILNMRYYIQAQKKYLYKGNLEWERLLKGDMKRIYWGNHIFTEFARKFLKKIGKGENVWCNDIRWTELPDWEYLPEELGALSRKKGLLSTNYQYLYSICKFAKTIQKC